MMAHDLPYENSFRPVEIPECVLTIVTPVFSAPTQGTVQPASTFDANSDAAALKKAMKGLGCDSKAVVEILCRRSNGQRQQIKSAYKTLYGKDLIKDLISELHGHFEDVIVALLYTPEEFDARELRYAMAGVGTDEQILIEIMCTRTNDEIRRIREAYKIMFKRDLEHDLASETSGYFKRLLISLCNAGRNETTRVDRLRAAQQAQDLHQAGVKRWGTDEATFNAILCGESYAQLQTVFEEYKKLAGHDIEQAIKNEFSGDIERGLSTIVKSVKNKPALFAEQLHYAMVGAGTKDRSLIRVMVSRCEKDMVQIREEFRRMYKKSLADWIKGDTSGKYKDALLILTGDH